MLLLAIISSLLVLFETSSWRVELNPIVASSIPLSLRLHAAIHEAIAAGLHVELRTSSYP